MQLDEQETHVTYGRSEETVQIFSTIPAHIRKLRARDGVTVVRDEGDLIVVVIPRASFDPITGFKRKSRPLTPEERERALIRLAEARKAKK